MNRWQGLDNLNPKGLDISPVEIDQYMQEALPIMEQSAVDTKFLISAPKSVPVQYAEDFRIDDRYPTIRAQVMKEFITHFEDRIKDFMVVDDIEKLQKITVDLASQRATEAIDQVAEGATVDELKDVNKLMTAIADAFPQGESDTFAMELVRYMIGEISSFAEIARLQYPDQQDEYNDDSNEDIE